MKFDSKLPISSVWQGGISGEVSLLCWPWGKSHQR